MHIVDIKKKKNHIQVITAPPEHLLDLELGIQTATRMALDVQALNGGQAVILKIGEHATLTLNKYDDSLNSDIGEERQGFIS